MPSAGALPAATLKRDRQQRLEAVELARAGLTTAVPHAEQGRAVTEAEPESETQSKPATRPGVFEEPYGAP